MNAVAESIAGVPLEMDGIRLPQKIEPQTIHTTFTLSPEFGKIVGWLSSRPLRRPATRHMSSATLRRIAERIAPNPDYFNREEKKPF